MNTTSTNTSTNAEAVKGVVDAVFAELQILTAARPLLSLAVSALHQLVDGVILARVAARVGSK